MPLREGMLRRQGLDPDTVLYATADIAEQRDISRWLPRAVANLYMLVASYGSSDPPKTSEIMRSWGLVYDADVLKGIEDEIEERRTNATLKQYFGV